MRSRFRAVGVVLALSFAPNAWADGVADEAELHFQLGAERYIAKDFRGALEHFLTSNRLVPNRNVGYNIARTFEQMSRFADAHRWYVDARESETDPKVLEQIDAAVRRIAPNVAVLDVVTTPPGATIYIDRRDLGSRGRAPRPLAFPAGKYKVIVALDGYEPAESEAVDAKLGSAVKIELSLQRIVGTAKIEAEPGTAVHLDDEKSAVLCVAPCELPLAPAAYSLVLTREGFQSLTRQVIITARQTSVVRGELTPLTGSVVVSTDEREALVEIDGRSVGFTPVVVPNIPVGARTVRVSLRGFNDIEKSVDVLPNQQTELLELRMDPIREVTAASRVTESIEDAPSSVTIIPRQELRAFAYPTIAEALRGVRGFSLSNDSIYSSINVRGIGQPNDYGNRLLVLSDGMILNDNILSSSYIGYDGRTDLADIERIEVVRGAGSVLYGTGAMSGVVNLVTRSRDAPNEIHANAGTFENAVARIGAGFQYKLEKDAGVWASVAVARSDGRTFTLGPLDGVRTGSTTGSIDAFESGTTSGRIWWGPLTAQWFYTSRDVKSPLGAYGTVFGDARTTFADTRGMAEVRFEPEIGKSLQVLMRGHANTYRFKGNYAYDVLNDEVYEGTWLGGEARVLFTPLDDKRTLRISVGGTVERHLRAYMEGTEDIGGANESYIREDHPFTLGAAYGLVEASPVDWFRFSLGGRLDIFSTFGATFNPRLALIFKPVSGGVLKVLGGRAFRSPSVYELYYNDGGFTQIGSPDLQPEVSYSGEIEYSQRFAEDWVFLLAGHLTWLDAIIETKGDGTEESPLQYLNSTEPVLTVGGEVELRREWRQGWMVSAMYGYQRANYDQTPEGYTGTRILNAPEHLASVKGAAPIVPGLATLASRLSVEGGRRFAIDSEDTTETAVVADVIISGDVQRFNLHYSAGVYNLFDWRYSVPITEGAPTSTLLQTGRTFLLEVMLTL